MEFNAINGIIILLVVSTIAGAIFLIFKKQKAAKAVKSKKVTLIGRTAVVVDTIKKNRFGKVKLAGKPYSAIIAAGSSSDKFEEGEKVEIVASDGKGILSVKPVSKANA